MNTHLQTAYRGAVFLSLGIATICVSSHCGRAADAGLPPPVTTTKAADPRVTRWESDIRNLEALDKDLSAPDDAVLFLGSSSIRLWDTIAEDMAPLPVIRRGYGGARYRDLCHFVSRLIEAHRPRTIVVFVANDITDSAESPSPDQVMVDVRATHAQIRHSHPEVPVFYVAVTPTQSRWEVWPTVRSLNALIEEMCRETPNTHFIVTADRFIDRDTGQPKPEFFRDDRLHLNQSGYKVWAEIISAALANPSAEANLVRFSDDEESGDRLSRSTQPLTVSPAHRSWAVADGGQSRVWQESRRGRQPRRLQPLRSRSCRCR